MSATPVTLYVYDVSNGMAKMMSPMIVGKVVEGIWHTSIVVYNKEYYFQGGAFGDAPKTTPFGLPVKELPIGTTELNKQEFEEYLDSISDQFTSATYDLFTNNCNHYSSTLSEFLIGDQIPKEYLFQAQEYVNTPIGGFIKSMNDAMKAQVQSAHMGQPPAFGHHGVNPGSLGQNLGGQSSDVNIIKDDIGYVQLISANDKVVVDFGAEWCGPCKNIKPVFEQLAKQYKGRIAFASVNIDNAKQLASSLGVTSIPVFLFLNKGQEYKKFVGANQGELKSTLEKLDKEI